MLTPISVDRNSMPIPALYNKVFVTYITLLTFGGYLALLASFLCFPWKISCTNQLSFNFFKWKGKQIPHHIHTVDNGTHICLL